jgi:hypothetical protein
MIDHSGEIVMPTAQDIVAACKREFPAFKGDCSGFARAVAARVNVPLTGLANDIVDHIRHHWRRLPDGAAAKAAADSGEFVIAGLRGDEQTRRSANGHVVIVVAGDLDPTHRRYPHAYWGKLRSTGKQNETLNHAWNKNDRDRITYAAAP